MEKGTICWEGCLDYGEGNAGRLTSLCTFLLLFELASPSIARPAWDSRQRLGCPWTWDSSWNGFREVRFLWPTSPLQIRHDRQMRLLLSSEKQCLWNAQQIKRCPLPCWEWSVVKRHWGWKLSSLWQEPALSHQCKSGLSLGSMCMAICNFLEQTKTLLPQPLNAAIRGMHHHAHPARNFL